MIIVDYPEDFVVLDERTLPRMFDDDELPIDLAGYAVISLAPVAIKEVVEKAKDVAKEKTGRLAEIVVEKEHDVEKQLALLTLAWLISRYGLGKPWPQEVIRKLLPRDQRLRRWLEPLVRYTEPEEVKKRRDEERKRRREKKLERLLSERGFDIVQQVAEMYNEGKPVKEIREKLGLTWEEIYAVIDYAERLKMLTRRKRKFRTKGRLTKVEKMTIIQLYKDGKSLTEIAKIVGRPVSTVNYILKKSGLK